MTWEPTATAATVRARGQMLDRARDYFRRHAVLAVETPILGAGTATDPNLDSMTADTGAGRAYLQTSPEHFMKRLLAAGYPDIYQVSRVFRSAESGRRHLPEFTMIEWYRLGFELDEIVGDAIELTSALLEKTTLAAPASKTYRAAFVDSISIDPMDTTAGELADALDADDDLRETLGQDLDAWLDLAMASRVSPSFAEDRLTVVTHYPASQAALARLTPGDPATADRFELFLGPLEIANGFVELRDPDEQRRRFEADREKRLAGGKPVPDVDAALIAALRAGLPACAGVALGLDRVLMIDEGLPDIRQATTFIPAT